jgi:hypothetical protein
MWSRCADPTHDSYKYYGGIGVAVDPRWEDFKEFVRDMGARPTGCTLDRIRVAGGYTKDNCRWSNPQEQARNRHDNIEITFRGETKLLIEWAEELNINYQTLIYRIRCGWDIERALTKPSKRGWRGT